ncbi:MAG: hypothetical protein IPJ68_04210 [Candidatus Moraniibacteriota bacterium]|nr:MAG: hypothetical protein IPJ68_04210 [Candidatus Moranbacteria bacterium]
MSNPWEQSSITVPAAEQQTITELLDARLEKLGIDENIRESVIALNQLNFVTTESCEGHLDHGNIAPRIRFEAPSRPEWRYIGEREAFESVAQANGITVADIRETQRPKYGEDVGHDEALEERAFQALQQARTTTPHEKETSEFIRFREATDVLAEKLKAWITEYERSHESDVKLTVDVFDDPAFGQYGYFLHVGGADYLDMADPEALQQLPEAEQEKRHKQHTAYREAMKAFTDFLRQKI